MFRSVLVVGLFFVAGTNGYAQTTAEIDRILLAAPPRLREEATVVGWSSDGTRVVHRAGSNGVVCWDQSDEPRKRGVASRCTSEGNLPRIEENRGWNMSGKSQEEIQAMMDKAEEAGTRKVSEFGSVYYSVNSEDVQGANIHMTIAVPFATSDTLSVPSERTNAGVWIMSAGTSGAHLMIPGR